jgi:2-phospho-L-lactate guanylyltransferase
LGAHHFHTSADLGLNHAAREVAEWLSYKNIKTMCLFPADIPLVQAAEFQLAARAHVSCSEVTIIPSQNDGGTNCLILSPPDILPFCFGKDSHIKHLRQAEKLNLSHQTENFHGIAQDIDTPADLLALMAKPQQTLSQHFLEKINLRTRLYQPFR